jgi:uncharacterized protein with von Willebrand factor type A (vWA) domain
MADKKELRIRMDELSRALKEPNIVSYIYNRYCSLEDEYKKYQELEERANKLNQLHQLRNHADLNKPSVNAKISALEKDLSVGIESQ